MSVEYPIYSVPPDTYREWASQHALDNLDDKAIEALDTIRIPAGSRLYEPVAHGYIRISR